MRINRFINGKKTENMPKEIRNAAVREVLGKAEGRIKEKRHV